MLITHGDWDHVCGIAAFPEAVVAMGEETAAKVEDGSRVQSIQRAVDAYGFVSAGPPRVDQTFQRGGAIGLGEFAVETFPLVGHTPDGTGFRFRELGLLVVGDHLSPVEFPFATSPSAYRSTLAGLVELLREDPPETVIPGHGPPLTAEEALGVAEADLRYLRSLHVAVVEALAGRRDTRRGAGGRPGRCAATRVVARSRRAAGLQRRAGNRGSRSHSGVGTLTACSRGSSSA